MIGVIFDAVVCYLCKNLDLYGAEETDKRREFVKEDAVMTDVSNEKKELNGNLHQKIESSNL